MKHYEVTIHENLEMKVTVEAGSAQEAEEIVERRWKNSDYILDADNFTGAEFKAKKVPELIRGR